MTAEEKPTQDKPHHTERLWRRMLQHARPCWPHLIAITLLQMLAAPLALLTPLPLKIAVDSVIGKQPLPASLVKFAPAFDGQTWLQGLFVVAALMLCIGAVLQLQSLATWILQTYTGERLVLDLRHKLFHHVQRLSLNFHNSRSSSETLYRLQQDAAAIQFVALQGLIPLMTAVFTFLGMIVVTSMLDRTIAAIALVVAPALVIFTRECSRRVRSKSYDVKDLDSSAMSVAQEVLGAVRVVKAFGQEGREDARFQNLSRMRMNGQLRLSLMQAGFHVLIGLTITLGATVALVIGLQHVKSGGLTVGGLLLVMAYLAQLYEPLRIISTKISELQGWLASVDRAFSLLDQTPETADRPGAISLKRARGYIEFRDVTFAYKERRDPQARRDESGLPEPVHSHPVVRNMSFQVPAGSRVGILGPTGAGKTTVLNLLKRFYDPCEGKILLDGIDLREYRLADLRDQFSVVLQDTVLFSTTIAENIAYARPNATKDQIIAAARAANAHEFIQNLPDGYRTQVGERGAKLSGGQKQRISLARAFLKDAPLLILDEPTSAVDVKTETAIMSATRELMRGRTTFMIAHRLSTLESCDILLVLEDGELKHLKHVRNSAEKVLRELDPELVP